MGTVKYKGGCKTSLLRLDHFFQRFCQICNKLKYCDTYRHEKLDPNKCPGLGGDLIDFCLASK